jgi:MFS family permease
MPQNREKSTRIPGSVWALGFVSSLMDISSEMIHSLLPVFLVAVLSADATSVGLIEGVAEAAALVTRLFSGRLSDRLGQRKILALAGYALGALTKPLFALAPGVGLVFTARFLDRIGKGVRGAPRDALIADVTAPHLRGAAYGLRQSLDTVGALIGPLVALALMMATAGKFRVVFWVAGIPGLAAVGVLAVAVREPPAGAAKPAGRGLLIRELACLKSVYWLVVAFGSIFTLARFSEAFLLLRAEKVGMSASLVPMILIVMNIFYALTAYPSGRLSDRLGRTGLITAGLLPLIASDVVLAMARAPWQVAAGASLWGLHMGLTQGLLAAMVADASPSDIRGTAFGVFSLASGIAVLLGNLTAGWLWDRFGAPATFYAGAGLAGCALIGFMLVAPGVRGKPGAATINPPPGCRSV